MQAGNRSSHIITNVVFLDFAYLPGYSFFVVAIVVGCKKKHYLLFHRKYYSAGFVRAAAFLLQ